MDAVTVAPRPWRRGQQVVSQEELLAVRFRGGAVLRSASYVVTLSDEQIGQQRGPGTGS
jgi:hypothetical protein